MVSALTRRAPRAIRSLPLPLPAPAPGAASPAPAVIAA